MLTIILYEWIEFLFKQIFDCMYITYFDRLQFLMLLVILANKL